MFLQASVILLTGGEGGPHPPDYVPPWTMCPPDYVPPRTMYPPWDYIPPGLCTLPKPPWTMWPPRTTYPLGLRTALGLHTPPDYIPSGRTQVLYKAHVLYCALFWQSCFFFLWKLLKGAFLCFIFWKMCFIFVSYLSGWNFYFKFLFITLK